MEICTCGRSHGQEGPPRVEHGARFKLFGRRSALAHLFSSQWLAPHDVRTGFYRYLKPGQPPDDKLHVLGRITATAPMCKRGSRPGLCESHGLIRRVTIDHHGRNFVIIGSATGIYTARRGKSGESCSPPNTRGLCNLFIFRSHRDPEPNEPDIDIHPPRLQ